MPGCVASPHGETFRNANASARRARPCGVACAAVAAACSAAALAALSENVGGPDGEIRQLDVLGRSEQLADRIFAVELVLVELIGAGHEPAGGQRSVQATVGVLILERADQATHRRAERVDVRGGRAKHGLLDCRQRLELVANRAAERPPRAVRIIGRASHRVTHARAAPPGWSDREHRRRRAARIRGCREAASRSSWRGHRRSTSRRRSGFR